MLGAMSLAVALAGETAAQQGPAVAPAPAPQQRSDTGLDDEGLRLRAQELDAARSQQKAAEELQQKLKADIAAIGQDRGKLNQQLIDSAARVREIETKIADSEARLRPLDAREREIHDKLDSRRSEIIEVLAALQRAGRRAPPALLVRPEDALQSLRTAMLLGAVVPEMRARAQQLTDDLTQLVTVRRAIAEERDRLAADREKLTTDRTTLAALVDERQKQQSAAEKDLDAERSRAVALARQVESLQDLIGKMERDLKSARAAAAAAAAAPPPPAEGKAAEAKTDLATLKDPGRLSPAVAFASARGLFAFPVNGAKIRDFGAPDGVGGVEKGISLAARPGAQVTTPCDGWVVYAGPFRSYGQLLILNAGGGYHVLIAGMERISVNIGQFVLTGEPVATMGTTSKVASILATAPSQPVLYVEFRKDGTPIDPSPWWAASEGEKVRG
ncbi:MAG: peptidoglycan DD-metalloendopeptidase family protein [Xanthobacteraceae bacterium]|nr:peptidoglycan DD-metalloendopeptidase family protein [Xanthobacteraceae bacterium]